MSPARRRRRLWPVLLALGVTAAVGAVLILLATSGSGRRGTVQHSAAATSGPAVSAGASAASMRASATPTASPAPLKSVDVKSLLKKMTLPEKVGQLFMTYAYGASATDADPLMVAANIRLAGVRNGAQLVARYHLGGIVLFGRNTFNPSGLITHNLRYPVQIARLTNGLQKAARSQAASAPLLIATDQEQGLVTRIGPPATQFPGNMALGADGSAADAFSAAEITGEELRAMGVNMVFAPVADVNVEPLNPVIGVRSFGSDPTRVAKLTTAAVRGYQAAGIAATAKHFPGHGDTSVDSHYALPVIHQSLKQVERVDLPPFAAAIDAGVAAVMVGHLDVPALDRSGLPASLSHAVTTGWLRGRLAFNGVVITDALGMNGVRSGFSDAQAPVLAIQAGADIILMPPNIAVAYNSVLRAVRSGVISEKRLDKSVTRILKLKASLGLFDHPYVNQKSVMRIVGTPLHRAIARKITRRTITVVKAQPGVLPLRARESVLVTGVDEAATAELARGLSALGVKASLYSLGLRPGSAAISAAAGLGRASRVTVVTTINAAVDAGQRALVAMLVRAGRPVIVVALGDPYDIASLPGVGTYLATYNARAGSIVAVSAVLAGRAPASGKLPVSILRSGSWRSLYPLGYGLRLPALK